MGFKTNEMFFEYCGIRKTFQQKGSMTINVKRINYIIIIDGSGSMQNAVSRHNPSKSRWQAMEETTIAVADKVGNMDPDGADILLMHDNRIKNYPNQKSGDQVKEIFLLQPNGGTPTAEALKEAFSRFQTAAKKGDLVRSVIIVFTDGAPNDTRAVEREIVNQTKFMSANDLEDNMCTVLFIQVGDDSAAEAELTRLDEGLKGKCNGYDIVDTQTIATLGSTPITTVVLAAIDG